MIMFVIILLLGIPAKFFVLELALVWNMEQIMA